MKLKDIFECLKAPTKVRGDKPDSDYEWEIMKYGNPIVTSRQGVYKEISITDIEKSIVQESPWMDYNVYVNHKNWYTTREQIMLDEMRKYLTQYNSSLLAIDYYLGNRKIILNKNTKVL
jgi:hypothetical protein